jgi:hypothetical protein
MHYIDLNAVIAGRPGGIDPGPYLEMLAVLVPRLPAGARAFAADPEHYDFTSGHCVKDLTISRVQFRDDMPGLEIVLRHNCWKHEDDLVVGYRGVRELATTFGYGSNNWTSDRQVILDEILPHDHGCSHEIAFWSGSLTVICRDLTATWIPALCPEEPAKPASGQRLRRSP